MQIGGHARPRVNLDALGRVHDALERSVDRDPLDVDLGIHLGRIAQNQLTAGRDLALELSVDAEGLLEDQLPLQLASLVEKPVERRALTAWLHIGSFGSLPLI